MRTMTIWVSALVLLAACTPMGPRRLATTPEGHFAVQPQAPKDTIPNDAINPDRGSPAARSLSVTSWEHFQTFDVGIIELDEHGKVFSPEQRDLVLNKIREQAMTTGATVVVFVHGWHHSARWNDTNLVSFRRVLRALAQKRVGMGCNFEEPKFAPVIGVYIGWRG